MSICLRKRRYETWREAEDAALRVMDEGKREHVEAYRCMFCGGWHFGHPPRVSFAAVANPQRAQYREKAKP